MCGIAGIIDASGRAADAFEGVASAMASTLRHRGPDDHGSWADPEHGIALGHRRLSILDLTDEGRQPMVSASSRYVIVFNGEIYNHRELRDRLESRGHAFRGRSDTEVLLAAVDEWGARGAVHRLNGMFAFGLWDRSECQLHLARDRIGEKPLYYGTIGSALVFASELKAFDAHPGFTAEIDRDSVASFFRYKYVPSPLSIYRGIRKLPAASILSIDADRPTDVPEPAQYWDPGEVAQRGLADPFRGSVGEAAHELESLLVDAVGLRMQADVPLGAFLSGGVDSSTVVAIMQAIGERPARTFTIGSTDRDNDEARYARAVADHLGTEHTELFVTPNDAMDVIPDLPTMYDEPFADSSQIPTFLVSRLAREHVTVSLSGDGGDELFGGYDRYLWVEKLWKDVGWIPPWFRRRAAIALGSVSAGSWQRVLARSSAALPKSLQHRMAGEKVHKLAGVLDAADPDEIYRRLVSHWRDPAALVLGSREPVTRLTELAAWRPQGLTDRMMFLDLLTYLPDDILAKVDRASMSVGLEARVPLLDHRVVEFAWSLPFALKVRDGKSKWLLRQVLSKYVPSSLIDRPKTGFGIPIGAWLRGPLRDWAETLLDERRLRQEGFLDALLVRRMWREHLSGKRDRQYLLWDALIFHAWLENRRGASVAAAVA
jgi:asparagine synthase (glutamine-hydrolysing)